MNIVIRQLLQEAKLELKKSKRKDYYKILGVEKTANDDEIKKAYRKRAMVHHPDRHSSASDDEKKDHETKFKEVDIINYLNILNEFSFINDGIFGNFYILLGWRGLRNPE